ncbi:hypothetical protein RFI_24469, partial [Reticulomyxa filosa]
MQGKKVENFQQKSGAQKQELKMQQVSDFLLFDKEVMQRAESKEKQKTVQTTNGEAETERKGSVNGNDSQEIEKLPLLKEESDPGKKRVLLIKKLKLCNIVFDFSAEN